VLGFHTLARLLGSDQPFYGLQSRGLVGDGRPLTRIEDIAATCMREIRERQPNGPYHLIGMSMGGVVGWAVAQQLGEARYEVGVRALLETWPPAAVAPDQTWPSPRGSELLEFVGTRLRLYRQTLAELGGRARGRYVGERLGRLSDLGRYRNSFLGVRAEIRRQRIRRATLLASQPSRLRPYPGPVILFYAEGRPLLSELDDRLRWHQFAANLEAYGLPADDSGQLLREPHVRVLAAQLAAFMQRGAAAPRA